MAVLRLRQAHEDFARSSPDPAPGWARFFDGTDLAALTGVVHTEPVRTVDPAHTATAIPALTAAIAGYSAGMARSRAPALVALATNHLLDNDFAQADLVGQRAVAAAAGVGSTRVTDRLRPLRHLAERHGADPHARDLAARLTAFTGSR